MFGLFLLGCGFLISFLTALALTPGLRRLAFRRNWLDRPDDQERKQRLDRIPRVGGIVIVGGFAAAMAFFGLFQDDLPNGIVLPSPVFLACGLAIAGMGLYDDLHGLNYKWKFAIQFTVAYVMIEAGHAIDFESVPFAGETAAVQAWVSIPLTLLWYVGIMNAMNLLDGLDGLAAGVSLISFLSLALVYGVLGHVELIVVAIAMAGVLSAFLIYNYHPASIYMGDCGSYFLGFLLASYALHETGHFNPALILIVSLLAVGLPVTDTGLALVRRFVGRRPLFSPDQDHIHHRTLRSLKPSYRKAVSFLYLLSAFLGATALSFVLGNPLQGAIALGCTALLFTLLLYRLGYVHTEGDAPEQPVREEDAAGDPVHSEHLAGKRQNGAMACWSLEEVMICWKEVQALTRSDEIERRPEPPDGRVPIRDVY